MGYERLAISYGKRGGGEGMGGGGENISRTTSLDLSFFVVAVCCFSAFFLRRASREEIICLTCANLRVLLATPIAFVLRIEEFS